MAGLRCKYRTLKATVTTMVKYGSEEWTLRKTEEDLLDVFQRNCLQILLGTRLTGRISSSGLCGKCGSILLSRAIMRESLRWLGHFLQMKHDRLHDRFLPFGKPSRAKQKAGRPQMAFEDAVKKD